MTGDHSWINFLIKPLREPALTQRLTIITLYDPMKKSNNCSVQTIIQSSAHICASQLQPLTCTNQRFKLHALKSCKLLNQKNKRDLV